MVSERIAGSHRCHWARSPRTTWARPVRTDPDAVKIALGEAGGRIAKRAEPAFGGGEPDAGYAGSVRFEGVELTDLDRRRLRALRRRLIREVLSHRKR